MTTDQNSSSNTQRSQRKAACAACNLLRRRCSQDCDLAPFFPPGDHENFIKVHSIFKVKKIKQMLQNVNQEDKKKAMKSLIFEANARTKFPAEGSYAVCLYLHKKILSLEAELRNFRSAHGVGSAQDAVKNILANRTEPNGEGKPSGDQVNGLGFKEEAAKEHSENIDVNPAFQDDNDLMIWLQVCTNAPEFPIYVSEEGAIN